MEGIKDQPILVPYDFTPVSDVALAHAANYSQICGNPIIILNIVDDSTQKFLKHHNQIDTFLNKKLQIISEEIADKYKVKTSSLVRKGKIISIRSIADELGISIMFIGIDQPQTLASKVLKVVGSSPAPVYIVQGDVPWKEIRTLVFPVDDFEETRQKISCTVKLAKQTNAKVKLLSISLDDRDRQLNQEVRVKQIEKILLENRIPFTTEYAKQKEKNFADELLEYAQTNNGDIFILMKTPRTFFPNLFISPVDKKVLLNSHNIPSIYINPRDIGRYN
jgi:nucleotide-binding universal stress UspA family protein